MMKQQSEVIRSAIKKLVGVVEDRVTLIAGDLIEPLNMYINHHTSTCKTQYEKANQILHNWHEKEIKHTECRKLYQQFGY